jgi:cellulose synthase/poly-beta-1,6-N-acetylglucosamine synthase-like glycosyltransferase
MMTVLGAWLFFCSLAGILTTYLLYPIVVVTLSRLRRAPSEPAPYTPRVTMIISAFNEATVIGRKIQNSLEIDYPPELLEVLVISDSSDDGTDEIVKSFNDARVILCRQEPRGGKSRGITQFMAQARGEVVVFSDANSMYDPQALRWLTRHFSVPEVGYVVGHQRYIPEPGSAVSTSEGVYWSYEKILKEAESRLSSVVGGDGAIYAFRRSLWIPLRDDDISDLVLPLRIVAQGYRGVYESRAVCTEHTAANFGGEFRRKVRIVNRSFRGVLRVPQTLNPFRVGWFAPLLFVHKVLRWLVPFFLALLLVGNVLLCRTDLPIFRWILIAQFAFFAIALLGLFPGVCRWKPVYLAYYFCMVNLAAARGVLGLFVGQKFVVWSPHRELEKEELLAVGKNATPPA